MYIIEQCSGRKHDAVILPVDPADMRKVDTERYAFDWDAARLDGDLYKLIRFGDDEILGLLALREVSLEKRVEIILLACSSENVGRVKRYERIAGCLIAFSCRLAVKRYGEDACVSLVPKTELRLHYIRKYRMSTAGRTVFVEGTALIHLLQMYDL